MNTLSIVTDQGTAMPEATLCSDHWANQTLRGYAEVVGFGAEDWGGDRVWHDSTENSEVSCVEC